MNQISVNDTVALNATIKIGEVFLREGAEGTVVAHQPADRLMVDFGDAAYILPSELFA